MVVVSIDGWNVLRELVSFIEDANLPNIQWKWNRAIGLSWVYYWTLGLSRINYWTRRYAWVSQCTASLSLSFKLAVNGCDCISIFHVIVPRWAYRWNGAPRIFVLLNPVFISSVSLLKIVISWFSLDFIHLDCLQLIGLKLNSILIF